MAIPGLPKNANLRDGTQVLVRPVGFEDAERLLLLYRSLPEGDRLVLRDDVTRKEWSERFLTRVALGDLVSVVAQEGDRLVGEGSLYLQRHGWMAHIGELRINVDRAHRRLGLGFVLARELVRIAEGLGLEKLMAQMVATQEAAQRVFRKLGFREEAVLHGHVKDAAGAKHDLLLLSASTAQTLAQAAALDTGSEEVSE